MRRTPDELKRAREKALVDEFLLACAKRRVEFETKAAQEASDFASVQEWQRMGFGLGTHLKERIFGPPHRPKTPKAKGGS